VSVHRNPAESEIDPDAARVRNRLRALRSRYPGVVLATNLTHIHDDQVVVRASISLPDGSSVSAHAAEPTDSSGLLDGAIELAEQRATARALDVLGVGDVTPTANRTEQTRAPHEPGVEERTPPPVVDALRKASLRRPATQEPAEQAQVSVDLDPEPTTEADEEPAANASTQTTETTSEPNMADYTWTHFWTWARANELSTKGQVEQRIGRPIDNLTPHEVRQILHETGIPL
jgi:hypothetical protein